MNCLTCKEPNCNSKKVSFWNKRTAELVEGVECFCSKECKNKYYASQPENNTENDPWLEVGSKAYKEFLLECEKAGRS